MSVEVVRFEPGRRADFLALHGDANARRVEAFPKRGEGLDPGDLWNGPEALLRRAGFTVAREDPVRPVLAMDL